MKVIDLTTKALALHVRLDGSPVYDLLAAMYLTENWNPDRGFDIQRPWIRQARRALGPALLKELRLFARQRGVLMGLVALLDRRPGTAIRDFIKLIGSTPPPELVERLLMAPQAARPAAPLLREAMQTRTEPALRALLAAYPQEFDAGRIRTLVSTSPVEVRDRLSGLVRGFYAKVYQREEGLVLPLLRADLQAKARLMETLPRGEVIERATGGIAVEPDSGMAQVILAPSYFFRPYNLVSEYPGVRVFVYPVDVAAEASTSSTAELARLCKALGDETRLRILQMLSEREMYLQEVANRLGVTHVTAIHHLALLRAAHLVRAVEKGNLKYYQLRPERVAEVEPLIRTAIQPERTASR